MFYGFSFNLANMLKAQFFGPNLKKDGMVIEALSPGIAYDNIGIILIIIFLLRSEFPHWHQIKIICSILCRLDMCPFAVGLAIGDSSLLCHLDTAVGLAVRDSSLLCHSDTALRRLSETAVFGPLRHMLLLESFSLATLTVVG